MNIKCFSTWCTEIIRCTLQSSAILLMTLKNYCRTNVHSLRTIIFFYMPKISWRSIKFWVYIILESIGTVKRVTLFGLHRYLVSFKNSGPSSSLYMRCSFKKHRRSLQIYSIYSTVAHSRLLCRFFSDSTPKIILQCLFGTLSKTVRIKWARMSPIAKLCRYIKGLGMFPRHMILLTIRSP